MPYSDAEYYRQNRTKYIERAKKWKAANPERAKQIQQDWRKNNVDKVKTHQRHARWKQTGIDLTTTEYDTLLHEQSGVCALCKQPPKKRRLAVDHCHETGRVRGLLCYGCNVALGYLLRLDRIGMDAVRSYLEG